MNKKLFCLLIITLILIVIPLSIHAISDPAKATFVIDPQFEDAWPFSEGLALVEVGGKWGYVDKRGESSSTRSASPTTLSARTWPR